MQKFEIGLIGLATMGANLARNLSQNGIRTVVYNRSAEKTKEFIGVHGNKYLFANEDLLSFVNSLEKPRKIILMVKAGPPVDEVINQLTKFLEAGDLIVDCGNSNYRDTNRREKELASKQINFVGCGISGGEEGALHGPSLMPGGTTRNWELMKSIWMKIAAKDFEGNPCVTHIGKNGAGHYVKMVHNGIEYAVMQIMAEAYDLFRKLYKLPSEDIANIFAGYGRGKLGSYLFEIVVPILQKKDDSNDFLINKILDKAGQKGTGKWTAIEGLDRAVGVSTISEAVFARINSGEKELRTKLAKKYIKPAGKPGLSLEQFTKKTEDALYASLIAIYAQGFELIKKGALENNWNINFSEICRIWQGGCIIRAKMLQFLTETYKGAGSSKSHLLENENIQKIINESFEGWRDVVGMAINSAIAIPGLTSSLQYIDTLSSEKHPANLIQGLRDYFGAHTYERTDMPGAFHTNWDI